MPKRREGGTPDVVPPSSPCLTRSPLRCAAGHEPGRDGPPQSAAMAAADGSSAQPAISIRREPPLLFFGKVSFSTPPS